MSRSSITTHVGHHQITSCAWGRCALHGYEEEENEKEEKEEEEEEKKEEEEKQEDA